MKPRKLPYSKFIESLKLCPRVTIELLLENAGGIFLIKRENYPFAGCWHLPGGFLLKGELIGDCVLRLCEEELGIKTKTLESGFVGLFETIKGDPRGHLLHYLVRCSGINPQTSEKAKYFLKLPGSIIPYHKKILNELGYK